MSAPDTTQDTLTDRLVSTATIAIVEADEIEDGPGSWIRPTVLAIQEHLAAELIALEQLAGRPLSLQDATAFLLAMRSQHVEFPELTSEAAAALDVVYGVAGMAMRSDRNRVLFAAFLREAMKRALDNDKSWNECWDELEAIADNLQSPPPLPPTLAEARAADLDTPAGKAVVRDFLATLGEGVQL